MILMHSVILKCSCDQLKYYNEIQVMNWLAGQQSNTPKEQLFLLLFDHIAVLQLSLVMFFRGYIFLPSNSEFDLNG